MIIIYGDLNLDILDLRSVLLCLLKLLASGPFFTRASVFVEKISTMAFLKDQRTNHLPF